MRSIVYGFLLSLVSVMVGCANQPPEPRVHQPMSKRPERADIGSNAKKGASLYSDNSFRPLFEDNRARYVGDTLTIVIAEKNSASKQSSLDSSRKDNLNIGTPTLSGGLFNGIKSLGRVGVQSNNTYDFQGKGDAALNNAFNGNISVTVIEVLNNGNLLVSGEKQVAINQGVEYVRFSGVVNPNQIVNNSVQSSQVADARLEYKQDGVLGAAQTQGWLSQFFLSISPF